MQVGVYIIGTLVLSVVSDFTSKSTHYMARPDNLLNLYFVKFSWGWTLLFTSAFVFVTSRCVQPDMGSRNLSQRHLGR